MSDFFRFPHTPHLAWLGPGMPRDDKVLSAEEVRVLLNDVVSVEEKLDGANLGISLCSEGTLRLQNRGAYLEEPYGGQFSRLERWLTLHEDRLFDALDENLILFGEWCAARHSLDYDALPDWWLLFDVYERSEQRFWSTQRRNALAAELGLPTVPCLRRGRFELDQLKQIASSCESRYREGAMEGVVVRREDTHWLLARGKLVRAEFTQAIEEHWRQRGIEWNRLSPEGD